jgi:predicted ATPase
MNKPSQVASGVAAENGHTLKLTVVFDPAGQDSHTFTGVGATEQMARQHLQARLELAYCALTDVIRERAETGQDG